VFLERPRLWEQLLLPELSHYTCDYSDTGHHRCEVKTDAPPVLAMLIWIFYF
jgi:hypothetical protein